MRPPDVRSFHGENGASGHGADISAYVRDPSSLSGRAGFMPIFTYHKLVKPSEVSSRFDFSIDVFRSHIDTLKASGIKCVVPEELLSGASVEKSVMITFDDGYESDHDSALPMLASFGFRAVTFITASLVGRPGYLTWEKIKELSNAGFSVQSHSFNHRFLSTLGHAELLDELKRSKETIEDRTAVEVKYIAAPGGRFSPAVIEAAAKAGYSGLFNSKPGFTLAQESGILVFNRFVFKNSLTEGRFRAIARKDPFALFVEKAAYDAKNLIRKALGKK